MIGEFFIISGKIKGYIAEVFSDKKDYVLDLGCGASPNYHKLIKGHVICFDKIKSKITDVIGDADNLPFKANSFDKVISINSFYYFKNPFNVVKELHKVLRKDGKLILVLPFFYPIHDAPDDKYRFTEYGLKTALEEDFRIGKIDVIGGIFNLPAVFIHSLIKGLPLLFPRVLRKFVQLPAYLLWPFYIFAQIFSVLDVFDRTRRFPTYYFVAAIKK